MNQPINWFDANAAAARKFFPTSQYKDLAVKMATTHPRAIEYLTQAPVLVVGAAFRAPDDHNTLVRNYIAGRFGELVKRGVTLKEMFREYRLAYQLRVLSSQCICGAYGLVITVLSQSCDIHPSALAQAIPVTSAAQKGWLRDLNQWGSQMDRRDRAFSFGLSWAAIAFGGLSRTNSKMTDGVTDIADFYLNPTTAFDEKWTLKQAKAAAERWHLNFAKLNYDVGLLKRLCIDIDSLIDYSPLPQKSAVFDFNFIALDTAGALIEEGAAMHHCVATYIPDVVIGRSRIYSIRGRDQERIATLELRWNGSGYSLVQLKSPCNRAVLKAVEFAAHQFIHDVGGIVAAYKAKKAAQ